MVTKSTRQKQKEENDRRAAAGREARLKYMKIKKAVMELEAGNRNTLIFFRSISGDKDKIEWWKLCEYSALFYAYNVAKRLKKRANLVPDKDDFSKSQIGTVSFVGKEKILEEIKGLGLKIESEDENMVIVRLPQKVEESEITFWLKDDERKEELVNKIVLVKNPVPQLENLVRQNHSMIYNATKRLETHARETMGRDLVKYASEMRRGIMWLAHAKNAKQAEQYMAKIEVARMKEMFTVKMLLDLKLVTYSVGLNIMENLVEIKTHMKYEK